MRPSISYIRRQAIYIYIFTDWKGEKALNVFQSVTNLTWQGKIRWRSWLQEKKISRKSKQNQILKWLPVPAPCLLKLIPENCFQNSFRIAGDSRWPHFTQPFRWIQSGLQSNPEPSEPTKTKFLIIQPFPHPLKNVFCLYSAGRTSCGESSSWFLGFGYQVMALL